MTFDFDLANIPANEGLAISVTGMLVVFVGLTLVSLLIFGLPRILDAYDRARGREPGSGDSLDSAGDESMEEEIAAAIAIVIDHALTPEDGSAAQRITIRRTGSDSIWRQAGQMRSLSNQLPRPNNR